MTDPNAVAPADNPTLVLLSKASEEYGFTKKYLSRMVKDDVITAIRDAQGNTYLIRDQLAAGGLHQKLDAAPGPSTEGRTLREPTDAEAAMELAGAIGRVAEAVSRLENGMAGAFEAVIQEQKQQHQMMLSLMGHGQTTQQPPERAPVDGNAVVAALDGLLALYGNPNAWAKNALALNDANQSVDPLSPAASAWSVMGALQRPQFAAAAPAVLAMLTSEAAANNTTPEQVLQRRNNETAHVTEILDFLRYVRARVAPELPPNPGASYADPNPTPRGFAGFGSEPNPGADGVGIAYPAARPFGDLNPNNVAFGIGRDSSVIGRDGAYHQF